MSGKETTGESFLGLGLYPRSCTTRRLYTIFSSLAWHLLHKLGVFSDQLRAALQLIQSRYGVDRVHINTSTCTVVCRAYIVEIRK